MKKKQRVNIPEDIKEIRQDSFQDLEDKQGPERWIKINLLQCGAVCVNYFDHSCPYLLSTEDIYRCDIRSGRDSFLIRKIICPYYTFPAHFCYRIK